MNKTIKKKSQHIKKKINLTKRGGAVAMNGYDESSCINRYAKDLQYDNSVFTWRGDKIKIDDVYFYDKTLEMYINMFLFNDKEYKSISLFNNFNDYIEFIHNAFKNEIHMKILNILIKGIKSSDDDDTGAVLYDAGTHNWNNYLYIVLENNYLYAYINIKDNDTDTIRKYEKRSEDFNAINFMFDESYAKISADLRKSKRQYLILSVGIKSNIELETIRLLEKSKSDANKVLYNEINTIININQRPINIPINYGDVSIFNPTQQDFLETEFNKLNKKQKSIVENLNYNIEFIQGPPGTGKSQTILGLSTRYANKENKMLISAVTNKAIESIMEKFHGFIDSGSNVENPISPDELNNCFNITTFGNNIKEITSKYHYIKKAAELHKKTVDPNTPSWFFTLYCNNRKSNRHRALLQALETNDYVKFNKILEKTKILIKDIAIEMLVTDKSEEFIKDATFTYTKEKYPKETNLNREPLKTMNYMWDKMICEVLNNTTTFVGTLNSYYKFIYENGFLYSKHYCTVQNRKLYNKILNISYVIMDEVGIINETEILSLYVRPCIMANMKSVEKNEDYITPLFKKIILIGDPFQLAPFSYVPNDDQLEEIENIEIQKTQFIGGQIPKKQIQLGGMQLSSIASAHGTTPIPTKLVPGSSFDSQSEYIKQAITSYYLADDTTPRPPTIVVDPLTIQSEYTLKFPVYVPLKYPHIYDIRFYKGYDHKGRRGFFNRVIRIFKEIPMFTEQYRMHLDISNLVSYISYNCKLETSEKMLNERRAKNAIVWCDIGSTIEQKIGTSHSNVNEATAIVNLIQLIRINDPNKKIMIITFYKSQIKTITDLINDVSKKIINKNVDITVETVDSSQGSEQDCVIISPVRCNLDRTIGFVKNKNRVMVALSRAKEQVFIVGNIYTLCEDPLWRTIYIASYYSKLRLLEDDINMYPRSIDFEILRMKHQQGPQHLMDGESRGRGDGGGGGGFGIRSRPTPNFTPEYSGIGVIHGNNYKYIDDFFEIYDRQLLILISYVESHPEQTENVTSRMQKMMVELNQYVIKTFGEDPDIIYQIDNYFNGITRDKISQQNQGFKNSIKQNIIQIISSRGLRASDEYLGPRGLLSSDEVRGSRGISASAKYRRPIGISASAESNSPIGSNYTSTITKSIKKVEELRREVKNFSYYEQDLHLKYPAIIIDIILNKNNILGYEDPVIVEDKKMIKRKRLNSFIELLKIYIKPIDEEALTFDSFKRENKLYDYKAINKFLERQIKGFDETVMSAYLLCYILNTTPSDYNSSTMIEGY